MDNFHSVKVKLVMASLNLLKFFKKKSNQLSLIRLAGTFLDI